jgi:hypothetical protein
MRATILSPVKRLAAEVARHQKVVERRFKGSIPMRLTISRSFQTGAI